MRDRFLRALLLVLLAIVIVVVARPYIDEALFAAKTPRPVEARGDLAEIERLNIEIFQRASPSVVQIAGRVGGTSALQGGQDEVKSGSGFVWDRAGNVVTNNHVVENAQDLQVRLASGEVARANVIGTAPNYDLAVIQIRTAGALPPPLAVGSSADLKVGQFAYAIGNPFGLDETLTTGIISALKRRLPTSGGREIAGAIQTDAPINPGNSGGPLLDSAGRLIGVNTAIYSPSGSNAGVGFAIPVDVVNRIVPDLIGKGRVATPGIGIQAANEAMAARLGVDGVVVVRTMPGSPAEQAGIRGVDLNNDTLGDVIVAANGTAVHKLSDLVDQLEKVGIGRKVELTLRRGDQTRTTNVDVVDISRTSS
jgi:S1-C subfamily serine protease